MRTKYAKNLTLFLPLVIILFVSLVLWTRNVTDRRNNCTALTPGTDGDVSGDYTAYAVSAASVTDEPFPTIWIVVSNGAWEMYAGNTLIDSYQTDLHRAGAFPGESSHLVNLPKDIQGQMIRILLYGKNANIETLLYGDYENLFRIRLQEGMPALFVGAFMLLFGIIFFFLTTAFSIRANGTAAHVAAALVSVNTGIWLLTSFDQSFPFVSDRFTGFLSLATYYLMLPLVSMMLAFLYSHRKTLFITTIVFFAVWLVVILLHVLRVFDMYRMHAVYDIILLLATVAVPVLYYRQRIDMYVEPSVEMQERGILMFDFCIMIYVISLLTVRYADAFISMIGMQLPVVGSVAFMVAQVLNYYLNIGESYTRRKQYEELNQLAYVDVMTGLPNRKSAQNVFRMLNATPDNYCIVSLDLNGLKQVNDNYGHKAGDLLLQTAASTLNEEYSRDGFHARLGGDEFVVVLNKTDPVNVEKMLEKTNRRLYDFGQRSFRTECGISYGFAFRNECPGGDSSAVFALADERMYVQKKAYHKKKLMEI